MDLYISVKDLGFLLLFLAGVTALVILSIVLIRLNGLIGKITGILDANKVNIDKTMEQLPDTVANVNSAVTDVRNAANNATGLIDGIGDRVSETAASVEDTYGEFIDVLKNIINIFIKIKDLLK